MQLKDSLLPDGSLDLFSPLGSSVDGLELAEKIQAFTGVGVRVPTGYLSNYRFIRSKWLNDQAAPELEYFDERKLEIWLNYCDTLSDAHDMVCSRVLAGYSGGSESGLVDGDVLKKMCGSLVFRALESTAFLTDLKVQTELSELIGKSAQINSGDFLRTLSNVLVEVNRNKEERKETEEAVEGGDSGEIQSSVMRSDAALRSFLRNKSNSEELEPGLRIQVRLNNLYYCSLKSERNLRNIYELLGHLFSLLLVYISLK